MDTGAEDLLVLALAARVSEEGVPPTSHSVGLSEESSLGGGVVES